MHSQLGERGTQIHIIAKPAASNRQMTASIEAITGVIPQKDRRTGRRDMRSLTIRKHTMLKDMMVGMLRAEKTRQWQIAGIAESMQGMTTMLIGITTAAAGMLLEVRIMISSMTAGVGMSMRGIALTSTEIGIDGDQGLCHYSYNQFSYAVWALQGACAS